MGYFIQVEKSHLPWPSPSLAFLRAQERNAMDSAYLRGHNQIIRSPLFLQILDTLKG